MRLFIDFAALRPGAVIIIRLKDGSEMRIAENGLSDGGSPAPDPGTAAPVSLALLSDLLPAFIDWQEVQGLGPSTTRDSRRRLSRFLAWLDDQGTDPVGPEHWIAYYVHCKRKHASAYSTRNDFRALGKFAAWLVEGGILSANPLAGLSPPVAKKEPVDHKAIQLDDLAVMLEHTSTARERALLMVFRDTGCRASEAVAMRWGKVHLNRRVIHTTGKRDKPRDLFLNPATANILAAYRETVPHGPGDPVWWGKQGPLTYSGLYQIFKRIARRAGVETGRYNPHAWRHAFGRDATRNGMPTATLQRLLGHESIETTEIYTDPTEADLRAAHERYGPDLPVDTDGDLA